MKHIFPAKIEYDGARYFVNFPDMDEAVTEGETLEEALFNAREVLTLTLEARCKEGMNIPVPSECSDKNIYMIVPSANVQSAVYQDKEYSIADIVYAPEQKYNWAC